MAISLCLFLGAFLGWISSFSSRPAKRTELLRAILIGSSALGASSLLLALNHSALESSVAIIVTLALAIAILALVGHLKVL